MIRNWLTAAAFAALTALPSHAFDIEAMSEAERDAFGDAVRDYLLANPDLLRDWITALQEAEGAAEAQQDAELVAANRDALFDDGHSWVGGNPEGDVTLVEFLDYRCSFCRKAHPEVKELVSSDGNIRKIVKEFPILGDESVAASRFALAVLKVAGDEAYGEMSDTLMTHRGAFSREALQGLADEAGLDAEAILAAMDDEEITGIIQENYALAERMRISGTPSFVLGDQMLRGYVPLEAMRQVVEEIRDAEG